MSEQEVERDYEAEARAQGWKAPEELPEDFAGEPVDAKTFVERGEQFVSLLKPRLDKLEKKLQYQEQVNKDLKSQYQRFEDAKQKEVEKLENELKETRRQAVTNGDGEAFDAAESQLQEIQEYKKQTQTKSPEVPEWAREWQSENDWYGTDPVLTSLADGYSEQLKAQNPYLSEREFLDKISEFVKSELPHKFGGKKKESPQVEGDGGKRSASPGDTNAKTYNNLPNDAKKECKRLMNEGIIKDKNQYAELYFAD